MTGVNKAREAARFVEFFREVDALPKTGDKGCKLWVKNGHKPENYAGLSAGNHRYVGSRLVLARKLGRAIRPGLLACHTCDVPACVNEDHLYEGTHKQNSEDMARRNRSARVNSHLPVKPKPDLKSTRWVQRPPARLSPTEAPVRRNHHLCKINDVDAITIRERYYAGGISLRALGAQYGVSAGTVSKIVHS